MKKAIAILAIALAAVPAYAQEYVQEEGADGSACDKVPELCALDSAVGDLKGAVLSSDSGVSVAIDEKGAKGSLQYVHTNLGHNFSATLTTPVEKESGVADLLGITGIDDTASLKLEYKYIFWPEYQLDDIYFRFEDLGKGEYKGAAELNKDESDRAEFCLHYARLLAKHRNLFLWEDRWSPELEAIYSAFGKLKLPTDEEAVEYLTWSAAGNEAVERTEAQSKADQRVQGLLNTYDNGGVCSQVQEAHRRIDLGLAATGATPRADLAPLGDDGQTRKRRVSFLGVNATLGDEAEFEFLDRDSLDPEKTPEPMKTKEQGWSAGFRAGWMWLSRQARSAGDESLTFSVSAAREHKAQDPVTLCGPVEDFPDISQIETCKSVALGAPTAVDSIVYDLEYRAFADKLGFAFRAFYQGSDDKPDKHGFEVPFFFLPNSKGGLQGGVRLAWNDVDRDTVFGVFVGKKFEITP